ncbi:hypothetical protein S101258_00390 [Lactiplantibacillus plantarum subsp. plantarum]|uniref:Peptidase S9 prolyl oligopeptidase catalytic domain-containing protein n=1 Tax=Lactiplantibacillus plantarum subsp. plantarum TaxID=337330 RepID=A0A2S3U9A2_LACPN|nr:hypothetical protein S101258_00390 [Lactiplantibacillus plantarum subsp. plantarum]
MTAVIKAITARSAAASGRTLLVGGSQGGVVAGLVASHHPKLVDRWLNVSRIFDDARCAESVSDHRRSTTDGRTFSGLQSVGRIIERCYAKMSPKRRRLIGGPVLIVHGDADDIVPIKYVRQAAANYQHGTTACFVWRGARF